MSASRAKLIACAAAAIGVVSALGWFGLRPTTTPHQAISEAAPRDARAVVTAPADAPGSASPATSRDEPGRPAVAAVPSAGPQPPAATVPSSSSKPSLEERRDQPAPSFDVVRVEPSGESVIAGRAAPGATVDLLRNGEPLSRVVADASGLFAIVPPELKAGSHEIVLQAIAPNGARARSAQSVTVVIAERGDRAPLVTITAPDQPTVVLSRPEAPAKPTLAARPDTAKVAVAAPAGLARPPAMGPAGQPGRPAPPERRPEVTIAAVEAEGEGKLFVSGLAAPGATLRLYLNDAFVAPGGTGPDGRLSFTIERGIRPGEYRVRLDDVDPVSGAVRSRAEVPFNVPPPAIAASPGAAPAVAAAIPPPDRQQAVSSATPLQPRRPSAAEPLSRTEPLSMSAASQPTVPSRAVASAGSDLPVSSAWRSDPGQVVVPEINTAIVSRGETLWRISKRVYGRGLRYTVIYDANTRQIRDPDLIYPGQVFVLPSGHPVPAP